jgi:hypothetical protein
MLVGNYSGGLGLFFGKPDKIFGLGEQLFSKIESLYISPNPAQDKISIFPSQEFNTSKSLLIIKGMDQKIVRFYSHPNVREAIDVSGFANGVYLVSLLTDRGMANGKLVICR